MSSLWTPGGEHDIPRPSPTESPTVSPSGSSTEPDEPMLSPEDEAELRATADEVSAIRAQLAQAPADMVVANHVMGLYELAAVHLSQDPPHFVEARLAIDAMTGVMERCKGRLGDAEATLVGAVQQLQLTFVTLTSQQSTG